MKTTLPGRMKTSPKSEILARAFRLVSANRWPLSMSHDFDFTRSLESSDAVRDTYLQEAEA